jgi:hypothetical protein
VGTGLNLAIGFANPCSMAAKAKYAYRAINMMQAAGGSVNAVEAWQKGNRLDAVLEAAGVFGNVAALRKNCFAAGTPLLVPGGSKAIELIREGELVLARSEFDPDGPVEAKVVEEVFVRVAPVYNLHVRGRIVRTTDEHPFYVKDKGWTPTFELKAGDLLQTHEGDWVSVEGVADSGEVATVYNLCVANHHTYFVGCEQWGFDVWAHNSQYATQQELAQDLERISPSRVRFRGMEVRATRKLDHLTEGQLRYGYANGVSPRNPGGGGKIILHHHQQKVEGPLIEMPQRAHKQSNRKQHPLGNSGGVGNGEAKGDFNNWRKAYWQARYAEELFGRGLTL